LDPSITKADGLIGNLVGRSGALPETKYEIKIETHLLERVVGPRELTKVKRIETGEKLLLDIGTAATVGKVITVRNNIAELTLARPVCTEEGNRAALSRRIQGTTGYRLIGFGIVQ
jgi:translation initiation factor 2 subunit 3